MDIYSKFKRDLFNLYVKTKETSIENVFLRFSQIKDFVSWFRGNKKLIRSKVQNQSICDAIDILIDLRGMAYGDDPSRVSGASLSDLVKKFQESNRNLQTIPIIKIFAHFVDDPKFDGILGGLKDNIVFISKYFKDPENILTNVKKLENDKKQVADDLKIIFDLFENVILEEEKSYIKKPSLKQQRKDMFVYLLNRFSNEISLVFRKRDMDDIAQKIQDKILASSREDIREIMPETVASVSQTNIAKKMVETIWRNPDSMLSNYYYNLISATFLSAVGIISYSDLQKIKDEYEKQRDVMFFKDDIVEKQDDTKDDEKIDIDMTMNPSYLQTLAIFFTYYKYKLGF